jgi:hypothetical protein
MNGTGDQAIKDQLGFGTENVFQLSSMLDSTSLFGSPGACPSDVSIEFHGSSLVLPFSQMCGNLHLIGQALVAFSYLIAGFIVFRRA